jgi:hypothetical protein
LTFGWCTYSWFYSRPTPDPAFRRDSSSDFGVDRAATARGLSVGLRTAFLAARPRPHLRYRFHRAGDRAWHSGSAGSAKRHRGSGAYIERVIGTIRRKCLDHQIVLYEASLVRHLKSFVEYYHQTRTHLLLEKDTPVRPLVETPESGCVGCLRWVAFTPSTNVAQPDCPDRSGTVLGIVGGTRCHRAE